jgi:flagella basal body P-ring formation protein FlgA
VESQKLVKRGQQVVLLAQTSSIIVKMSGKAMADGAAGEKIKVKNLSSDRVIEGIVTENGSVRTNVN